MVEVSGLHRLCSSLRIQRQVTPGRQPPLCRAQLPEPKGREGPFCSGPGGSEAW